MKQTINLHQFRQAFKDMDRDNHFSYEGLEVLFDYLEECDSELELDVIAICCDFSQCSLKEFKDAFPAIEGIMLDEGLALQDAIEYYIGHEGGWFELVENGKEIIFQNF